MTVRKYDANEKNFKNYQKEEIREEMVLESPLNVPSSDPDSLPDTVRCMYIDDRRRNEEKIEIGTQTFIVIRRLCLTLRDSLVFIIWHD